EQSADNLGRLSATPNSGKRLDADQVVNTSLEALNLIGCLFQLRVHRQVISDRYFFRGARRSRNSRKNSSGGTKKGFSWTMPPMRIIGWVRMTSMIRLPPHFVRL